MHSGGTALRDHSLEACEQSHSLWKGGAGRVALRQCCLNGALGAELLGVPTAPPSRQQRCPRRRPCKPRFGEQHGLTYLGAVFNFIKTTCQHRQKVKKMDSEHWGLNAGLHAALSVPSTAHTLTHKQFFPGPFENELQMS